MKWSEDIRKASEMAQPKGWAQPPLPFFDGGEGQRRTENGCVIAKFSTAVLFASSHSHEDTSATPPGEDSDCKTCEKAKSFVISRRSTAADDGSIQDEFLRLNGPIFKLSYHLAIHNSMDICQSVSNRSARIYGRSETYKFHPQ